MVRAPASKRLTCSPTVPRLFRLEDLSRPPELRHRAKVYDHFWFTFFHECGHIILHGKKEGFLEGRGASTREEEEANDFAANHLIPRQALLNLMRERPLSEERLVGFA